MNIYGRVGWRTAAVAPAGPDADAQAFIAAASITDSTQQSAINTLVTQLKTYGVWSKLKAVYPFVGGTASQHKFNLKDPRDLDAAYRLVFNGGWTHSSTGVLPNGSTGYADTFLTPSSALSLNSTHVSYYSRTNNSSGGLDFGAIDSGFSSILSGIIKDTDGKTYFRINRSSSTPESNVAMSSSSIFYMINRKSSSEEELFVNNTKTLFSKNSLNLPSFKIYLGAADIAGTAMYNGSKESAFASIGDGLTDTEAANLYTAVQAYQTTLGRQV